MEIEAIDASSKLTKFVSSFDSLRATELETIDTLTRLITIELPALSTVAPSEYFECLDGVISASESQLEHMKGLFSYQSKLLPQFKDIGSIPLKFNKLVEEEQAVEKELTKARSVLYKAKSTLASTPGLPSDSKKLKANNAHADSLSRVQLLERNLADIKTKIQEKRELFNIRFVDAVVDSLTSFAEARILVAFEMAASASNLASSACMIPNFSDPLLETHLSELADLEAQMNM